MKINNKELFFITCLNILIVVIILIILRLRKPTLVCAMFSFIIIYYIYTYNSNLKIIYFCMSAAVLRYIIEILSSNIKPEIWKLPFWTLTYIFIITIVGYLGIGNNTEQILVT